MPSTDTILIVIVAIAGLAVLGQFILLVALLVTVRRGVRSGTEFSEDMRTKVEPILTNSNELLKTARELIVRLEPRLDAAATDLAEMTRNAREEATRIEAAAREITDRVLLQAERVDAMATTTLDNLDRVGHFLNEAVNVPMRQLNGVIAAARAVIDVLRSPPPPRRPTPATGAQSDGHARDESGQFV